MNIVNAPLTRPEQSGHPSTAPTVRAMEAGQHVIAVLLTVIGVVRAIGDGTALAAALVAGLAILAWHTAGTIFPSRVHAQKYLVCWVVGLALIWGAAVAVSPEFVWLAFLIWLLAGHLLPGTWAVFLSVLIYAVVVVAPLLHDGTTTYANVFGPLIGGVFALGISRGYLHLLRDAAERERLVSSLTRAQQEMAKMQEELAVAGRHAGEVAERTRLSRDIHDTVAQTLSSIRLVSHAGIQQTEDVEAGRALSQVEALAGDSLTDVRRIIAALAPSELERDALAAAFERILTRLNQETGIVTTLNADDSLPALPTEVEVALLRTAQSALANVRLHADASHVVLSLIDAEDTVRVDIIDDGVGFDAAAWGPPETDGSSGYGLRFMRARLRELGGGLEVESVPGEGTAISAFLPIHTASKEKS